MHGCARLDVNTVIRAVMEKDRSVRNLSVRHFVDIGVAANVGKAGGYCSMLTGK